MSILLYRVDDRLIHGQVVIGWGSQLHPDRYLVIDDGLAESAWERELFALAVGAGEEAEFRSVEEARALLPEWRASEGRTLLLTRDIDTMLRMARGGLLEGESVNLGGIHHAEGRSQVGSYLHLDPEDRARIEELVKEGVTVFGRDLPGSPKIELSALRGSREP